MRKKPDFLIIGVQKGGTSSLFNYLDQHPDLILPGAKEIHFFDNNYAKGITNYLELFPKKPWFKKIKTGEASPYYIFHPHAAKRIKEHLPGIKLIVLLRDPVIRAYSHYSMQKNKGIEDRDFLTALENEINLIDAEEQRILNDPFYNSTFHQKFSYLSRGYYFKQIVKWFEFFPTEQFLFIRSEDLFENPKNELSVVYQFLGLRQVFPAIIRPVNAGKYSPLDVSTYKIINNYYHEQNEKLTGLIGSKFTWNSI